MPFEVIGGKRKYQLVNTDTGRVLGKHKTRTKARRQHQHILDHYAAKEAVGKARADAKARRQRAQIIGGAAGVTIGGTVYGINRNFNKTRKRGDAEQAISRARSEASHNQNMSRMNALSSELNRRAAEQRDRIANIKVKPGQNARPAKQTASPARITGDMVMPHVRHLRVIKSDVSKAIPINPATGLPYAGVNTKKTKKKPQAAGSTQAPPAAKPQVQAPPKAKVVAPVSHMAPGWNEKQKRSISPKALRALARRHPAQASLIGAGLAVAASGGLQHKKFNQGKPVSHRRRNDNITAATVGAAGGQAAWLGTGFKVRAMGHKAERQGADPSFKRTRPGENRPAPGLSRTAQRKVFEAHRQRFNLADGEKTTNPQFYRQYPRELPASPYKRILGHMSGTKGRVLQGTAIAGGAGLGLAAAQSGRYKKVKKGLGDSPSTRILETGAGLGLLGWGLSRSPMLGAALGRGIRQAQMKESQAAVDALQIAQSAYGAMARGTARGERSVRQVKRVNQAIERVPTAIRPAVATAAGMLLVGHAYPVRRESHRPVTIRIRTGVSQ